MANRSLRGMRIGSHSMETEDGVEFAPRLQAHYDCPNGHTIILPFSVEADVPVVWECRCGEEALLRDASRPEVKAGPMERNFKPLKVPLDIGSAGFFSSSAFSSSGFLAGSSAGLAASGEACCFAAAS